MTYQITSEQLVKLLQDACISYEEYREQHGYVPAAARLAAIGAVLDGMTAERELVADVVELATYNALLETHLAGQERDRQRIAELESVVAELQRRGVR